MCVCVCLCVRVCICVHVYARAQCFCLSRLRNQSCQLSDIYKRARPLCCIRASIEVAYVNVFIDLAFNCFVPLHHGQ